MGVGGEYGVIGYRVVSVDNGSPMSKFGIEPMTTFILYSDQHPPFSEFIGENENRPVSLTLFNMITRERKEIDLIPQKWSGPGLLGATLRLENYLTAHLRTFRVLHFYVDSPMHKAGLKTKKDYILGNANAVLKNIEEFIEYISEHDKELLEFYVYNSDEKRVRKIILRPDKDWGGPGLLGGDLGFGGEHTLPLNVTNTQPSAKTLTSNSKEEAKESSFRESENAAGEEARHAGVEEGKGEVKVEVAASGSVEDGLINAANALSEIKNNM
eukprot:TRINITY_DN14985_c0_g1_i17.p1 TRINITY_DN14985_c0_g1~~TRINITY_DN14985_c0_g1_i17.p1  ORF type:complete len:270 (+),score=59.58 TRINITY_DN14985_c0_g1_i17:142-951(+)